MYYDRFNHPKSALDLDAFLGGLTVSVSSSVEGRRLPRVRVENHRQCF